MKYAIKLKNGLKFVVISKYVVDGETYLYLVSDTDEKNCIFARCVDDKYIEPVEDDEINEKLIELVSKDLDKLNKSE